MIHRLELRGLTPDPRDEWRRLLRFVGWNDQARRVAARSVEILFRRGPELVADTYAYLARVPETAAILGWEKRVDDEHLSERRRFFTVWLARTLGLDSSDEFALYLFRAGAIHAGHGPRKMHVPPAYVTGSIGLVQAQFARYLADGGMGASEMAEALAAWSAYLSAQLDLMLLGYRVARDLDSGDFGVPCRLYGRLRMLVGAPDLTISANEGATVADCLHKFFDYFPQARADVLERVWESHDDERSDWREVVPAFEPRPGWRVLWNGRDVQYGGGFATAVDRGDTLELFPPGR